MTTVLLDNYGVGFAPCRPDQRDQMIAVLEGVENVPGIFLAERLPWNWVTFLDFIDADFAVTVPHIPVCVYVMCQRAIDREPANSADMQQMAVPVKQGLEAGAFGFSTTPVIGIGPPAANNCRPSLPAKTN